MVPRTTWFRWTSQAKGKPKASAAHAAMQIPGGRMAASRPGAKAVITNVLAASAATNPNPKPVDLMSRMIHALDMIDQLERTACGDDGEINRSGPLRGIDQAALGSLGDLQQGEREATFGAAHNFHEQCNYGCRRPCVSRDKGRHFRRVQRARVSLGRSRRQRPTARIKTLRNLRVACRS